MERFVKMFAKIISLKEYSFRENKPEITSITGGDAQLVYLR